MASGRRSRACGWVVAVALGIMGASDTLMVVAAPLPGGAVTLTQPDGRTVQAWTGGDEWFTWISYEGRLIARDDRGWWRYATQRDGGLQPDGAYVGRGAPSPQVAHWEEVPVLALAVRRPAGLQAPDPGTRGRAVNRPALVVLVEFLDQALSTSDAYWNNLFFGSSGKTGRTYFDEVSGGALQLVPAAENSGTANDGVVRVTLPSSAHNSGNHPNPYGTIDNRNRWIVYDGLSAADAFVDFSAFDASSPSGALTPDEVHLVVVVAGYEHGYWVGTAPPTPAIHSHRWALGFAYESETVPAVSADGVTLCDYAQGAGYVQVGEVHTDHPATVGVPCHELGHDMGLIDLYDTTLASHGIGAHGLMGYGVWGTAATDTYLGETPVHPCAWSKVRLGFATPVVAAGNQDYTLWATGSAACNMVRVNTRDPNQYFLIENRQLQGFDAGLYRWFSTASGGLAIWHVDDAMADNHTWAHKRVDLEEANTAAVGYGELDYMTSGNPPPEQGKREHYFYAGQVADFGNATNPNSKLYDARMTYVNVSSVSAADSRMKCFIAAQPGGNRQMEWSTYLGGAQNDRAYGVAVDANDAVYVVGDTNSSLYPTTVGAYDTSLTCANALFITKLGHAGNLIYSTFFHDVNTTYAPHTNDVTADSSGCVYLTGYTWGGLPVTAGAYDTSWAGNNATDGFITKMNAAGSSLVYSTYLGGTNEDRGYRIALDSTGNAYVTGLTYSSNFPATFGAFGIGNDIFVTKLNAAGSALAYSRLFGATQAQGSGIATDAAGAAYVSGIVRANLPTTAGAYDTVVGGSSDAFAAKLGPSGSLDYCTYLGGTNSDQSDAVAVDALGNAYIGGMASSSDFPTTAGAYDTTFNTSWSMFVTKLYPAAYSPLTYSTFLDLAVIVPDIDRTRAIALDSAGQAYVGGVAYPDTTANGTAVLAAFDATAASLIYSATFGGTGEDQIYDIALDSVNALYAIGVTNAANFSPPMAGGFDTVYSGGYDAFVIKIGWDQVASSVVVGTPDGGEVWRIGRTFDIRWSSSGAGTNVSIELARNGSWETLYTSTANDGSEPWTVVGAAATDCVVRIQYAPGALWDDSNSVFSIANPGDLDGDGDVDGLDYGLFAGCLAGPGMPPSISPVDCGNADLDDDGAVDLADFAEFQIVFGGSS